MAAPWNPGLIAAALHKRFSVQSVEGGKPFLDVGAFKASAGFCEPQFFHGIHIAAGPRRSQSRGR